MKILCISSCGNGHLDFGGMGYLKTALALRDQGNDVHWLCHPVHTDLLRSKGLNGIESPLTDMYQMNPFFSEASLPEYRELFDKRVGFLKMLLDLYGLVRPDVILLDRILPMCQLAAAQVDIPCVGMGTPGGDWIVEKSVIHRSAHPVDDYVVVGELFKSALGWKHGALTSAWVNSEHLNICFLGRSMYSNTSDRCTAFVQHFQQEPSRREGGGIGVSFGNSGMSDRLVTVLDVLLATNRPEKPPQVFSGKSEEWYKALQQHFGSTIDLVKWVNFSEVFPTLGVLAYHGGTGTTWDCINHDLPMLVVPGSIGDQDMNSTAIAQQGMGECIGPADLQNHDVLVSKIEKLLAGGDYTKNIQAFRESSNFTDTLTSVTGRIAGLLNQVY